MIQRIRTGLADELRGWCKDNLRRYEYPHLVEFVDDFPRTATGKIQRFKLRETEQAHADALVGVSKTSGSAPVSH